MLNHRQWLAYRKDRLTLVSPEQCHKTFIFLIKLSPKSSILKVKKTTVRELHSKESVQTHTSKSFLDILCRSCFLFLFNLCLVPLYSVYFSPRDILNPLLIIVICRLLLQYWSTKCSEIWTFEHSMSINSQLIRKKNQYICQPCFLTQCYI